MEALNYIGAVCVLFLLLGALYVGPTYFRRLGELIEVLKRSHPEVYEQLHKPSISNMDISVRNSMAVASYLLRKEYLMLSDPVVTRCGDAARWRLVSWVAGFCLIIVVLPLVAADY